MGLFDIMLMVAIAGGAFWLLYRSLWKKKGCCSDDCGGNCH
ncbi:MAG: FeoB-associated Cys-rich membrane protein [Geobacter sp.]|nr:FeoB-associated Cys-rich membrane protein [Geobacter sp.]